MYKSDVLELVVRRKLQGNLVQWTLTFTPQNRIVLNIMAKMEYKYSLPDTGTRHGVKMRGGWGWGGKGYGFINMFPTTKTTSYGTNTGDSSSKPKHVRLAEALFWNESRYYHVSGEDCTNVNETCTLEGCGVRIWSLMINTHHYTTGEEDQLFRQEEDQTLFLSLVAYHSGDYRIIIHRDGDHPRWGGKAISKHTVVAVLSKVDKNFADDEPRIDQHILKKHLEINPSQKVTGKEDVLQEPGNTSVPQSTSTPVKRDGRAGETQDPQVSPVRSTCDRAVEQGDIDEISDSQFMENYIEDVLNHPDWQETSTECDICHFKGRISLHLHSSSDCLRQLRSRPAFNFKGSDDCFIVKLTLIIGECPNPNCTSGRHKEIPQECVQWWKDEGWNIMGWRGSKDEADADDMKRKIKKFLKNYKTKTTRTLTQESQSQSTQSSSHDASEAFTEHNKCCFCGESVELMLHLNQSESCLAAYVRHHLPADNCQALDSEIYRRKSLFQLSAILKICARGECQSWRELKSSYLGAHLGRSELCLDFYRREIAFLALPNWNPTATAVNISRRVSYMRRDLNEHKLRENYKGGIVHFEKELSEVMSLFCSNCALLGPLIEDKQHQMLCVGRDEEGMAVWHCGDCAYGTGSDFQQIKEKFREDTMRMRSSEEGQGKVLTTFTNPFTGRPTLAPSSLTEINPNDLPSPPNTSTYICVPNLPAAAKSIQNMCDKAMEQKTELNKYCQEVLGRPFVTDFQETFSCLFRCMAANLKSTMIKIHRGLSSVTRGEIIRPNVTTAKMKTPNLGMTMSGALRDVCPWSVSYKEKRSEESRACSIINGQVKVFFRSAIINDDAEENLGRILLVACRAYVNKNVQNLDEIRTDPLFETFLIQMSPVILKYIHIRPWLQQTVSIIT